ncbi:MAG: glycoprotein, partial [Rhodococcus sp. (in: high G+C Gram-positive bacteria)]
GSRTITVPAQVDDSRNLAVDFSLTTLDGQQLGEASTVSVRSNAYGQALAIITASAGVLLLLLAGRRLLHRFRGQPDPADEGYERP